MESLNNLEDLMRLCRVEDVNRYFLQMVGLEKQLRERPIPPTIWGFVAGMAAAEWKPVILRNVGHPFLRGVRSLVAADVASVCASKQ